MRIGITWFIDGVSYSEVLWSMYQLSSFDYFGIDIDNLYLAVDINY